MLNCCLVQICEGCVVALRWKDFSPYWTRNMFIFLFLTSFSRIVLFISSIFCFYFCVCILKAGPWTDKYSQIPKSFSWLCYMMACVRVRICLMDAHLCPFFLWTPTNLAKSTSTTFPDISSYKAEKPKTLLLRRSSDGICVLKSKGFNVRLWLKQILLLGCASILH